MSRSFAAGGLAVFAALALSSPFAMAHDFTLGTLVVEDPWARATPRGAQVGGGYLTITNRGHTPDRLVGGSFAASDGFALHEMSMNGGIMTMRPTGPLDIPAGGSVTLDPAGKHIMFTGLKRSLKKGETVPGTLVFEHAGTLSVQFDVAAIGAKTPGQDGMSGHDMPGTAQ